MAPAWCRCAYFGRSCSWSRMRRLISCSSVQTLSLSGGSARRVQGDRDSGQAARRGAGGHIDAMSTNNPIAPAVRVDRRRNLRSRLVAGFSGAVRAPAAQVCARSVSRVSSHAPFRCCPTELLDACGGCAEPESPRSWEDKRGWALPFELVGDRAVRRGGGFCRRLSLRWHMRASRLA